MYYLDMFANESESVATCNFN